MADTTSASTVESTSPDAAAADSSAGEAQPPQTLADSFKALREKAAESPAPDNVVEPDAAHADEPTKGEGDGSDPAAGGEGDDPDSPRDTGEAGADDDTDTGAADGKEDAGEDPDPEESDDDAGEDGEVFVLSIPGRQPNADDDELEIDGLTSEQREGLLRLRKGYLRGEALRAERKKDQTARQEHQRKIEADRKALDADRAELAEIESEIKTDPAGFIQSYLKDRNAASTIVIDHMVSLLDDDSDEAKSQYDGLIEQLQELEADPVRRENHRLKRENERRGRESKPRKDAPAPPRTDPEVERVVANVRSFVPAGTDEEMANAFLEDALRGLHRHVIKHDLQEVPPEEVDKITARYRKAYGFESSANASDGPPAGTKNGKDSTAKKPSTSSADPRDTGKRLAKASARRREAVTAPAGGGAPPLSTPRLPEKPLLKDSFAALRKNLIGG